MAVIFGPTQWQFGTLVAAAALGNSIGGGFLICKSGGVGWIVAPESTEVTRTWYCRDDAVTTAQSITGVTGWFVPTCDQIQNPGWCCRIYWDCFNTNHPRYYWTSTEVNSYSAIRANFNTGVVGNSGKTTPFTPPAPAVRAFRCVTY